MSSLMRFVSKMASFSHKRVSTKSVFLLWCTGLLGIALVADFFWASSSAFSSASSYFSIASNWALISTTNIGKDEVAKDKRVTVTNRVLSPTFADLPAPELKWEQMPSAPMPRLDGYSVQIKNLLYVFAGYGTLDYVHSHVDVFNFTDNTWGGRFDIPKEMAHSHLGVATNGRYIYIVSGQYGPQCRGPTARTFSLDTETKIWQSLPPLPAPRNSTMERQTPCDGWQQGKPPHARHGALEYCSKGWQSTRETLAD